MIRSGAEQLAGFAALLASMTGGLGAVGLDGTQAGKPDRAWVSAVRKPPLPATGPERDLRPQAGARGFPTLDAYLAHLREHAAPMDRPWYREVRPGVYRLETGNLRRLDGQAEPRLFTREQLERRFGFRR